VHKFTACLAHSAAQQLDAGEGIKATAADIRKCQLPFGPTSCVFTDSDVLDRNFAFPVSGSEAWSVRPGEEDGLVV